MLIKENDIFRDKTNAINWHNAGYTGKNVVVVLLDGDGKAREHMKDYYVDVLGLETEYGHATNVGLTVHQFAPSAKIYMFDFMRNKSEAIKWIVEHEKEIDIINVSLAGVSGRSTPSFAPFEYIDIPLICSSGNDYYENRISYPARHDWTISIGAVHYNYSTEKYSVAGYSNEGEKLDAVSFSGIKMMKDNGYKWSVYGTSFASPTAVGLLACYIQWRKENDLPKITTEELRKFIYQNSIDIEQKGFDTKSGHGLFVLPSEIPSIERKINKDKSINEYKLPKGYLRASVEYEGQSVNAILNNGKTMVQLRDLSELIGVSISYNSQTRDVTFNGKKVVPQIIEGRSYLHVRIASDIAGLRVKWEQSTRTVILYK